MSEQIEEQKLIRTLRNRCLKKLRLNSNKLHWSHCTLKWHFNRVNQEIKELKKAIENNKSKSEIWDEAADICNFIAFIADNYKPKIKKGVK